MLAGDAILCSKILLTAHENTRREGYLDEPDIPLLQGSTDIMQSSKVLLIEADPAVQYTKSRLLLKDRYAVTIASNFHEAVQLSNKEPFDLIVLTTDSPELLNMSLSQFPPQAAVLIIADKKIAGDIIETSGGGMRYYLCHPCSNLKFQKTVKQAIDKSRALKEIIRKEVLTSFDAARYDFAVESGIGTFLENITRIAAQGTASDYVSIVIHEDTGVLPVKSEQGKYSGLWDSFLSRLESTPEPIAICEDDCIDEELALLMKTSGISGIIRVPLVVKSKTIGCITEIKLAGQNRFTDSDLSFTSILAWWASMAIDNTRVYLDYFKEHLHADRLLDHISFAQENERKRVAVEIHDGVAQWLVGASYDIKLCNRMISESDFTGLKNTIENIRGVLQKSVTELRRAISNLPLPPLEELGLSGVIVRLAEKLAEEGIKCRVNIPEKFPDLTGAQQKTFYWLIQESINNIRKHAQATCVDIEIQLFEDTITLCVTDNGVGFDVSKSMESRISLEHIGLLGMKERADFLNGNLEIKSVPGKGTSIEFSFSLLPPEIVTIART